LHELGVDPAGQAFRGIRYTDGRRSVTADFPGGPGRGVRRTALHRSLRAALDHAGVPALADTADASEQAAGSVRVGLGGEDRVLRSRYVLAADGLHSPTRRRLGLQAEPRGPRRHGLRRHFGVAPWNDHVEVHWAPAGEAYVTPVAED